MTALLLSLLLAAAPAPADPATPPAPPAPPAKEKMVCKKQVDTGSLVKGRRTCMTQSQYRRQLEAAQRDTANMQYSTGPTQ